MKNLIIILVIVLAVGGGAGAGFWFANTPENVATMALDGMVDDLAKRDEIAPLLDVLTQGSAQFELNKIEADKVDLLEGTKLSGKIYFNAEKFAVENLSITQDKETTTFSMYADSDRMYIFEDSILGGSYGLTSGDAVNSLENSIFAPDSKSDYALDEETYDLLMVFCELYDDQKLSEGLQKDYEKLLDRYAKQLWKTVRDHADFDSDTKKVKVGTERIESRVITISIDNEAMAGIVEDMYDYICADDDLEAFIDQLSDLLEGIDLESLAYDDTVIPDVTDPDETVPNADDTKKDPKTLTELYEDWLDEAEESVKEFLDAVEEDDVDTDLELEIVTPKLGTSVRKLKLSEDGSALLTLDFGKKGPKKSDRIAVTTESTTVIYEIWEDSEEKFDATLMVDDVTEVDFQWEKTDGTYTLKLLTSGTVIKGDLTADKNTLNFTVDKITTKVEGVELVYTVDFDLVLNYKESAPEPETDITSIFDVEAKTLEAWEKKLDEKFGDLLPEEAA